MKTGTIALLACFLITSCTKSHIEGQQLVTGKWELRQSAGGIAGTIDYEPGNGYLIEFDNNNQYRYIYPPNVNFIPRSGLYEIKESAHPGDWLLRLQYVLNNQTVTEKDSVRFDAGKLVFLPSAPCCDIPAITYEKLKK